MEDGDYSAPVIAQLNKVDADLAEARARRAAVAPEPIVLPTDLPAIYRAHIDDLAATLSDEDVSGRASEELHSLIDNVVVEWDGEARVHRLELRGKLLELLKTKKPAGEVGLADCESSLKLVAGARFGHCFAKLAEVRIRR